MNLIWGYEERYEHLLRDDGQKDVRGIGTAVMHAIMRELGVGMSAHGLARIGIEIETGEVTTRNIQPNTVTNSKKVTRGR